MTFLNISDELNYQNIKYQVNKKLESMIVDEGYTLFEPTFFEDYELFVLKNKRVKKESMLKFIDSDGKILVLRPDITTSLMGQIIPKWQDQTSLKIFYNSTIFRRQSSGQRDAIRQFGIELLGDNGRQADIDMLNLILKIFNCFTLDYVVVITNTRFLDSIIDELSLSESEYSQLKDILYRKSSYDLTLFLDQRIMDKNVKEILMNIFQLQGSLMGIESTLKTFKLNQSTLEVFNDIKQTLTSVDMSKVMIDLSLVSMYDYYDGILFKGYVKGRMQDILSGGRYDPLTENYGKKIPAIGFTLNTQELVKEVLSNE